jgi:hypothetical protein
MIVGSLTHVLLAASLAVLLYVVAVIAAVVLWALFVVWLGDRRPPWL